MAGFRIRLQGGERLKAALQSAARRSANLRPAWKQAGQILLRSIDQTFAEEGRSEPWEPLADSTVLARLGGRRKAYTRKGKLRAKAQRKLDRMKILQRSGQLLASITDKATRDYVEVGTNKVYAAIQHYGGEAGRKTARVTLPARPFIVVQPEDESAIAEAIEDYLMEAFRELG